MADRVEVFAAYARLAAQMIAGATGEQVAEVARLLALNTGWHHQRCGDLPPEELLRKVRGETLDEVGRRLRLDGNQRNPWTDQRLPARSASWGRKGARAG
jgi:hypothetical protein